WDGRANIGAAPDHQAGRGVERINSIRFGYGNGHRAIWTAFDVKGLSINVAYDRAIEAKVARQVRRGGRRKGRIDVNAVAGRIVVFLGDVDLRTRTRNETAQREHENCDNENQTRHTPAKRPLPPCFYNSTPTVCQGFTKHNRGAKGNASSVFPGSGCREQLHIPAGCETVRLC